MTNEPRFEELKASGKLPSPSGVALEIMRLAQREDATLPELARLVQRDPALTGRLLKFANSPSIGMRRPLVAVIDAVLLLGLNTVRQFALSLSVVSANRSGACRAFDYDRFWSGSLARALAAQAVTARERTVAPEEAFTCGLLSEVGRLALASAYPDEYGECLERASRTHESSLIQYEQMRFSIDHRQITLGLLKDWGLPPIFLEAVAHHWQPPRVEMPEDARRARFAMQLRLAAALGRFCIMDVEVRDSLLQPIESLAQALDLNQEELAGLWRQLVVQWQEWGQLLNIPTGQAPDLTANAPAQTTGALSRQGSPAVKVLLVDDDALQLTRLAKRLKAEGYAVLTARDGQEGLKQVVNEKPPIIITDWRMAPMDGMEFCKALRSTTFGRQIYVIMLTSAEDEETLVQAFAAGADDFVVKPVNDRVLAARVRGGQRLLQLQEELEREQGEIRRYVSELAIANRQLELMAMTDTLTCLPNRRYGLARLEEQWSAMQRSGRPLAVMILDLDHFKRINDSLGHDTGDAILVHVANIFRGTLRTADIVCRLGGEEFLVIAPNTDSNAAKALGERVRRAVERNQPPTCKLPRPLTVSIGIAVAFSNRGAGSQNDLLKQADRVLYEIKRSGRNGVRVCSIG